MGKVRTEDGEGDYFDVPVGQHLVRPWVTETQDSGFSDGENIQLGTSKALGKVTINTYISANQPWLLGGGSP